MRLENGSTLLLMATLVIACAGPPSNSGSQIREEGEDGGAASADSEAIDTFFAIADHCQEILVETTYFEALHEKVLSSISIGLEPPYNESATLEFTLGPVGFVENLELRSVTSTLIEAPFLLLAEAQPAFPRAPRDVRECIGERPFPLLVGVVAKFQCLQQSEYATYLQKIEHRLYPILYSARHSSRPGRGWVRVGLTLGANGQVWQQEYMGKPDEAAVAKVRSAIQEVGTFPPPPDFSRCFADKPIILRLDVQGP